MKRRKWPNLPPDVAAHVDKKVQSINWEALLPDLMDACAGCPARNGDREPDPLSFVPHPCSDMERGQTLGGMESHPARFRSKGILRQFRGQEETVITHYYTLGKCNALDFACKARARGVKG